MAHKDRQKTKAAKGAEMNFIPECFADTNLVKTLLHVKAANHKKGCNTVLGAMETDFADDFAVGLIDLDKDTARKPSLREFSSLGASQHLTLYKHKDKHHYLILINDILERFVLSCAEETNTDLKDFGFQRGMEDLKDAFKRREASSDPRITNLFRSIEDADDMKRLSHILNYLKAKKFSSDINDLTAFFPTM